jgi:fructose-1,6-bisphosphatase III
MKSEIKYLELLSKQFPNIQAASTEIINLEAILNLPKGTEHFVTDLHGEYEAFQHVLRNASGVIKKKVDEIFGPALIEDEKNELCTIIYYPEKKLKLIKQQGRNSSDWYKSTLLNLIRVLGAVSSKYTRSKVRKALPSEYSYIIEELLHESINQPDKLEYVHSILNTIISTGSVDHFIYAISNVIHRLTIDTLHIIGDIYDRGPGAHLIMDMLCNYQDVDFQWGNHDIIWMGAAAGSAACMANVVRICLRYANLETLEDGYGINLLPLASFALDVYGDDNCTYFKPKIDESSEMPSRQVKLIAKMHKAISIIQFKLEGEIIKRRKEFGMADRNLLHRLDFDNKTVRIGNKDYNLRDGDFPTVNPKSPYKLTEEEQQVVTRLLSNFTNNSKLEKHIGFLYSKGSLYLVRNSNLLFHGSMPLNEKGEFKELTILGEKLKGKALFDKIDTIVRSAYYEDKDIELKSYAQDFMWYLWCGPYAPPFDKDKMATFERYFIADKETHKETKGFYTTFKERRDVCEMILKEFGLEGEHTHIINGHIPVKTKSGESPIRAEGKLLIIDGGFSKPYQEETGIAGYTLIYNSFGLLLVQHEPFESIEKAVRDGADVRSFTRVVEYVSKRTLVGDTDVGKKLKGQIKDLKMLLSAYRSGVIRTK